MAAGEDQAQQIVPHGHRVREGIDDGHRTGLLPEPLRLAADDVDGPVARRDHEPGAGILGHAVAWPGFQGAHDGVLDGVFGEVDAAGDADERGQDPGALLPDQARDRVTGQCHENWTTGRTSMAPCQAAGICAATLTASSRSPHSTR